MKPIDKRTRYIDYYGNVKRVPDYPTLPLPPDPPTVGRPKRNRKKIKAARKQAAKSRRKS